VEILNEPQSPASPSSELERRRNFKANRDGVSNRLFAIQLFTRRTLIKSSPAYSVNSSARLWTPYLQKIVPNLVDLLRSLNSLSDPNSWDGLPAEFYQSFITPPSGLKKTLLQECSAASSFERNGDQTELEYQLNGNRFWITFCLQQWYK
jgi:hypothetical protein